MEPKLTGKQQRVLNFIRDRIELDSSAPTLRELCDHMGYRSIGSAQDMVAALRRKDFLEKPSSQKARCLVLTDRGRWYGRDESDEVIQYDDETLVVPCLGSVPAGLPLEAVEESVGTLRIAKTSVCSHQKGRKLFALKAEGESMIDAGIIDGDWLVVEGAKEAKKDEIVVARIGADATVKRLAKDENGWYLKPENKDFKPIYAHDEPFEVIGKVVALQRTL